MNRSYLLFVLFAFLFLTTTAQTTNSEVNTAEKLSVQSYESLTGLLTQEASAAKLPSTTSGQYQSYPARNSESAGLKKIPADYSGLAVHILGNLAGTNSSSLPGPGVKNTSYELLGSANKKGKLNPEHFSQLAFLDSATLVCIATVKGRSDLLLIDIGGDKMYITGRLPIPAVSAGPNKPGLFIDREKNCIYLPVNSAAAVTDKAGNLAWKSGKNSKPGIWIIQAVKNEDKKWSIDKEHVAVRHFYNNSLSVYAKNGIKIETVHPDQNGNLWLGFTEGLIGVLPIARQTSKSPMPAYESDVYLHNFNQDFGLINDIRTNFSNKIYERLKNSFDPEITDTAKIFSHLAGHPTSYTGAYLEDARNTIYYNLVSEANANLDSDFTVENEEMYWQFIQLDLDNPLSKNKQKLYDYFGMKVRKIQHLQNGFSTGNDGSVYATTNLGLYKLSFDNKKQAISMIWATPYNNSFLKDRDQAIAGSGTTPAFSAEHNEVVICDNDFPYSNLLIIDAKTGKLKNKFMLFDRSYGSYCQGGIVYSNNTILVSNTFGNVSGYPASGIMKFTSTTRGNWHVDYDWNSANRQTPANTATPNYVPGQNLAYIYHQPGENQPWQLSGLGTEKPKGLTPAAFSLVPDFSNLPEPNLDNRFSNICIGPQKSLYIGTLNGLLRIKSE